MSSSALAALLVRLAEVPRGTLAKQHRTLLILVAVTAGAEEPPTIARLAAIAGLPEPIVQFALDDLASSGWIVSDGRKTAPTRWSVAPKNGVRPPQRASSTTERP